MPSYVSDRLAEIEADLELVARPQPTTLTPAEKVANAATVFAALGNHKRLLTVIFLGDGEMTVTDLVAAVGCTRFALSQHLKELIALGILEFRSEGVWRYYSCKSKTVKAVIELLDQLAMADKLPKAPESLGT